MKVVHCKRKKYDVYIGRPSKWGNPFTIGPDGEREKVIKKYRDYILKSPKLLAQMGELKGKTLGCWCAPKACHGDVLIKLGIKEHNIHISNTRYVPVGDVLTEERTPKHMTHICNTRYVPVGNTLVELRIKEHVPHICNT